jgi:trans-aconitate methyltransferase
MADAPANETASRVSWNPAEYDAKHGYVTRYGGDLVDVLAPHPGERVLDLGCGTGHLTAAIAARGAAVVGVDRAASMIAEARRAYPDLDFRLADAAAFESSEPFDAVFSNAALHWIPCAAQPAVARRIGAALRPGGRLVAEFGGQGNIARIVAALAAALADAGVADARALNPWYFPTIGEHATLLEQHGFAVTAAALFDRPTPLPNGSAGLQDWLATFAQDFLLALPADQRPALLRATEARLRGSLFVDGVWTVDYRRLRIVAHKPNPVVPPTTTPT